MATNPFDDVRPLANQVFAVGRPAFRLGNDPRLTLVVTHAFVFAQHGTELGIWDVARGDLVASLDVDFGHAISGDGSTVAVKPDSNTYVYHAPFDRRAELSDCHDVLALSHNGQMLACGAPAPVIWDIATGKKLAELPRQHASKTSARYLLSADRRTLTWTTSEAVWRWNWSTSTAPVLVYRPPSRVWGRGFMANGAAVALDLGHSSVRVDLSTGQISPLPVPHANALSPSGKLMASLDDHAVHVHDIVSGAELWSTPISDQGAGDVAFGEDDHLLAYIDSRVIHIVDLLSGPRSYPAPSRFAGWLAEGIAAVERAGERATLTLPAGAIGSVPRTAPRVAPKPAWQLTPQRLTVGSKTITAGHRGSRLDKPEWQPELWGAAVAPDGNTAAVVVRRADLGDADDYVPDPLRDARHIAEDYDSTRCRTRMTSDCQLEYLAQLWSLTGAPKQLWQHRLARNHGYVPTIEPAIGSGPVAIDRAGKRVLVGTTDGDIQIVSGAGTDDSKVITLHHSPVTRIELSPGGGWVMSEDAGGEQRLWPLPPAASP